MRFLIGSHRQNVDITSSVGKGCHLLLWLVSPRMKNERNFEVRRRVLPVRVEVNARVLQLGSRREEGSGVRIERVPPRVVTKVVNRGPRTVDTSRTSVLTKNREECMMEDVM